MAGHTLETLLVFFKLGFFYWKVDEFLCNSWLLNNIKTKSQNLKKHLDLQLKQHTITNFRCFLNVPSTLYEIHHLCNSQMKTCCPKKGCVVILISSYINFWRQSVNWWSGFFSFIGWTHLETKHFWDIVLYIISDPLGKFSLETLNVFRFLEVEVLETVRLRTSAFGAKGSL